MKDSDMKTSLLGRPTRSLTAALILSWALPAVAASPKPLQTFTVKDHLQHGWTTEIVHFRIAYRAWRPPRSLLLTRCGRASRSRAR